jgi:hypothetical protein
MGFGKLKDSHFDIIDRIAGGVKHPHRTRLSGHI